VVIEEECTVYIYQWVLLTPNDSNHPGDALSLRSRILRGCSPKFLSRGILPLQRQENSAQDGPDAHPPHGPRRTRARRARVGGSFRSACSLRRAPQLPQQGWGGRVSGCARRGLICLYRGRIWLGDRWELRSKRRGVWRHSTSVGDPDVVFGGCGRPICSCPGRRLVPLGAA